MKTSLLFLAALLLSGLAFCRRTAAPAAQLQPRMEIPTGRSSRRGGGGVTMIRNGTTSGCRIPSACRISPSPKFYTGYGWYRKHFDVPANWSGKRLFLEFDGAFQDAEIFINGQRIGEHKGGYTGFSCDITGAVKTGDNRGGRAAQQPLESAARPARGRTRFQRRHLPRRAAGRDRAAARHLVWHVCHHAAGFGGVGHGERENGNPQRWRGGEKLRASDRHSRSRRENSRNHFIHAIRPRRNDRHLRSNHRARCQAEALASRPSVSLHGGEQGF